MHDQRITKHSNLYNEIQEAHERKQFIRFHVIVFRIVVCLVAGGIVYYLSTHHI